MQVNDFIRELPGNKSVLDGKLIKWRTQAHQQLLQEINELSGGDFYRMIHKLSAEEVKGRSKKKK